MDASTRHASTRHANTRHATIEDLDAILAIRAEVAAEGIWIATEAPIDEARDREAFGRTITDGAAGQPVAMIVAEVDGVVVGSIGLQAPIGIAHLGMNVTGGHRGQGVGTALLAAGIEWAPRGRRPQARPRALALERPAARRLYERHGFVEEGYRRRHYRRRDGSLWDSVVMGLVLDDESPGHDLRAAEPPR